ncbi:DUF6141 family protein [[Phormidium] sp. ETS-05]|uniref:DUF6141 family protein n=1 Tax=[Phormidium] sp. ETS-05 TaxID=222819 RepID=UPI0018EF2A5F|nr:DUF6141 family protein [[Phormidium] sp. ETS-05]
MENPKEEPMATEIGIKEKNDATLLYREVQQFRQFWIWLVLLVSSVSCLGAAVMPFFLKESGENVILNIILIVFGVIYGIFLPAVVYVTKLTTEVRTDGLYLSFYPILFYQIKIPYENVVKCDVKKYYPLRDYGGWGVRYGPKGKAYNVSGDRGVQLELANGERILIGSGNPEQLATAIGFYVRK